MVTKISVFGGISGVCEPISAICQPYVSCMSAIYLPYVSPLSAVCQLYISRMSAIDLPYISRLSAVERPYVSCMSAVHSRMSAVCPPNLLSFSSRLLSRDTVMISWYCSNGRAVSQDDVPLVLVVVKSQTALIQTWVTTCLFCSRSISIYQHDTPFCFSWCPLFTGNCDEPRLFWSKPAATSVGFFRAIHPWRTGSLNISLEYSKTTICQASWEKGIRPSKSKGTVNRGTIYIDLLIKLVFGGENWGPVNWGTVNRGFTVLQYSSLIYPFNFTVPDKIVLDWVLFY